MLACCVLVVVVVVEQESSRFRLGVSLGAGLRAVLRVFRLPCVLGFLWVGSRGDMQSCTNADAGRSCI